MKSFTTSFFSSWRFPTFVISVAIGLELLLLTLLLLPDESKLAQLTEEFRASCFGYDPATGMVAWIVVFTTFTVPWIVVLVVSISWHRELSHSLQRQRRAVAGYASMGLIIALTIGASLTAASSSHEPQEMPFPADALRTDFKSPEFKLTDHTGRTVQLKDFRGQVVLVTAIFSRCGYSCPIMMRDLQEAVASLTQEQRDNLRIAVITLDPENDTPEVLQRVAASRNFSSPPYHLLSGEPAIVEKTLDDFAFPRLRNSETGNIDHANLFIFIDRGGRIVYRFTVGPRQQIWLKSALQQLLSEQTPSSG